jgi:phenylacetate-CoA ligase
MRQIYSLRIYRKSPVTVQHVFVTAKGITYNAIRRGKKFNLLQRRLIRNEKLNPEEIESLQTTKLKHVITQAYQNVPYYQKLFDQIGFKPSHLKSKADLNELPLLDKQTLRERKDDFVASNCNRKLLFKGSTSGSTGSPLSLYINRELIETEHAFIWRQYRWAGSQLYGKIASFRGDMIVPTEQTVAPYWRYDAFSKELWFSSYHLSERTARHYLDQLQRYGPQLIYAYPSSIYLLAQYADQLDFKVSIPSLNGIVTSSETLLEHQKRIIQKVFGTRVFDWYGQFERVIFIGTCEFGSYHIFPDYGITEFRPAYENNGQTFYELVGSGFINSIMPLIRYRTGDLVTLKESLCECGRMFPRIDSIVGRLDDMVMTPEGKVVGRLDHIFKGLEHICLSQIIQESIDQITILVVPEPGYSLLDERKIIENSIERLGKKMNIKIHLVNDIPRLPNGKFKAVVSKINYLNS